MPRLRRHGVSGLDSTTSLYGRSPGASRKRSATDRIPIGSTQNTTSILSTAELEQRSGTAHRGTDREIRTRMDILEARHVRRKFSPLLGTTDSRWQHRTLAISECSNGTD